MKKIALFSATAFLLVACAANEVQFQGVSPSPVLNISNSSGSFVGKKVNEFTREYNNIHNTVNASARKLAQINQSIAEADSEYNMIINKIETKLQNGTTPSNPDLVAALSKAQENLGTLEDGTQKLASVASDVVAQQEKLSALKSTVNATYAIPGAYDVDHSDLNIISAALEQQENTNADLMSVVKADIAEEQIKAQQFRSEITRLNVDVAAGYSHVENSKLSIDSDTGFKTIKPVRVQKTLAKNKSIRTSKKRVKLGKKFGVIEDVETSSSVVKAKKSAKNASTASVQKALNTKMPEQAKMVVEPVEKIKGAIFSKDFPDENVEYYSELSLAVQKSMKNNPDSHFEVVAIMPMDTSAQEHAQNVTAKIFGDMLTMSVPAENLSVSARSEISQKVPTIVVIKK